MTDGHRSATVVAVPGPVPQPRFHVAYRELVRRIDDGELAAGDRLPSERWLASELDVSRTTVRRAVEDLVAAGLVDGAGRIAPRAADVPAAGNRLLGLTEMARERGLAVSADVLLAAVRPASLDEAEQFRTAPGADLFELRRRRLIDGFEVAIDHDLVPLPLLPDAAEIDFTTASLYGELRRAGHAPARSRMQIEAAGATDEEAELLHLAPGAPVLVASDTATDLTGRVVAVGRTVYRSDRHRFLATFTRSGPGGD